jgi:hypothetical protein
VTSHSALLSTTLASSILILLTSLSLSSVYMPCKGPPGRNETLGCHCRVLLLRPGPVHLPVLPVIYSVPPPTYPPPRRQTCFHSIHTHPSFMRPHRSPATHCSPSFPSCFGCTSQRPSGNCWVYIMPHYALACDCSMLPAVCAVACQQPAPTIATMAATGRLLGYTAKYPCAYLV